MRERISVLVLREDDDFSRGLREAGMEVTNLPVIQTKPLEDRSELVEKLTDIAGYDGLFFTSPAAARVFVDRGKVSASFTGQIYALGERAYNVLTKAGYEVVFDPSHGTAEDLVTSHLGELEGKRLLFLRGDRSMMSIPDLLKGKAEVDDVVVYGTVEVDLDAGTVKHVGDQLLSTAFDWICFFSPSAVDAFTGVFGSGLEVPAAVLGPTTARHAEERGFNVAYIADRPAAAEFAAGFAAHVNGR